MFAILKYYGFQFIRYTEIGGRVNVSLSYCVSLAKSLLYYYYYYHTNLSIHTQE